MRHDKKRHARPAERLKPRPALPLLGLPTAEEALPGRLLVLMSRLHRRERARPDALASGTEGAWPARHTPGETA